jgi:sugar phosphate isomerase/epimerase
MNKTSEHITQTIEIGICCNPQDAVRLPARAFAFLEVNVQNFLVPEKTQAEFRPNLEAARGAVNPVKSANCFLPGDLKCVGPSIDKERLGNYAETAFSRAAQVGMEIIVFGSGAARTAPDGYPLSQAAQDFVNVLRLLGPIAQRHGITLVVEPLNKGECNLINSLAEGADAVESCDHPNVRLLADYYHMLKEGEPATEIARFGPLIRHTHIAELSGRAFPGKSREDFSPFFQALHQAGYKGRLALECAWDNMATDLEPSMRYLRGFGST